MSILYCNENGWIISHKQFFENVYQNVKENNDTFILKHNDTLFSINCKFIRKNQRTIVNKDCINQRKRKRKKDVVLKNLDEVKKVEKLYEKMYNDAKLNGVFLDSTVCDYNDAAREISHTFFDDINCDNTTNYKGYNSSNNAAIIQINNINYIVPRNSTFYCYDINEVDKVMQINDQFDFILMDPPWWNKSVRRKKAISLSDSYSMLYNEDLKNIPISKLLKPNGTIAIWCTNSSNCLESILYDLFPAWKLTFIAKWYWIKITTLGDVVCDFNETHNKQPYEMIVIGSLLSSQNIPNDKVILSVPSAIHSHKPPLIDIFKPYLPEKPKCLEIFARYLLPDWHSLGLEVLKFQHLSLYEEIKSQTNKNENI